MTDRCELRVRSLAKPNRSRPLRHALAAFLAALELDVEVAEDILTAVGEALANALEHAYDGRPAGSVELFARIDEPATLVVDVSDNGKYLDRGHAMNRGFGLRIIRAIARTVAVERDAGTRIRMTFDLSSTAVSR